MKTERFEDIEVWQVAPVCRRTGRRELTRKVYHLTKKAGFVMKSARRSTVNHEPGNLSSYIIFILLNAKNLMTTKLYIVIIPIVRK